MSLCPVPIAVTHVERRIATQVATKRTLISLEFLQGRRSFRPHPPATPPPANILPQFSEKETEALKSKRMWASSTVGVCGLSDLQPLGDQTQSGPSPPPRLSSAQQAPIPQASQGRGLVIRGPLTGRREKSKASGIRFPYQLHHLPSV